MSAAISVSLKERKKRTQEMKEMRENRRAVLGKPMKPLIDILRVVVNRQSFSVFVPIIAAVTVQVQGNSSCQKSLARVCSRCAVL